MRIFLVDSEISGHHLSYLISLLEALDKENEVYLVIPDFINIDSFRAVQIKNQLKFGGRPKYFRWIKEIKKLCKKYKPDIIHFLYGDVFYRYFGYGLSYFNKLSRLIITCHHINRSFLRDISIKRIAKNSYGLVVHTSSLINMLKMIKVNNIHHIEYPQFNNIEFVEKMVALRKLGLSQITQPILLAIGGTRYDKGLDILLDALIQVKSRFHLLIAGKEDYFNEKYIKSKISAYSDKVTMILRVLSEEEFKLCLNCADIIVLPYRKIFDGASGPLGEGVWLNKLIIGPEHGSLGNIIQSNHLGMIFKSEDAASLAEVINNALNKSWEPDEKYEIYRRKLSPIRFQSDYKELYFYNNFVY